MPTYFQRPENALKRANGKWKTWNMLCPIVKCRCATWLLQISFFYGKYLYFNQNIFVTFSKVLAINLIFLENRLFILYNLFVSAFICMPLISYCRVYRCWEETASPWCFVWRDQEQKTQNMAEDSRTHYGEIPAALCGAAEKSHCKGGLVPVQKHLPAGTANAAFEIWQMCIA